MAFIVIAALFVFMPASYLLLDTTLAKARIRRAHVVRIANTALSPLPLLLAIAWTAYVVFASLAELAHGVTSLNAKYGPPIALLFLIIAMLATAAVPLSVGALLAKWLCE